MARDGTGGWRLSFLPRMTTRMPEEHGSAQPGAQRARLRALRRGLDPRERRLAERAIVRTLLRLRLARPGRRVGAYVAVRGETSVDDFIATALARGARVYLPRIALARAGTMHMLPIGGPRDLGVGAFGIPAPTTPVAKRAQPRELDLVLVPLRARPSPRHGRGLLRSLAASASRSAHVAATAARRRGLRDPGTAGDRTAPLGRAARCGRDRGRRGPSGSQ
jgi:5-formyltetrahydrofolate cyclo-ligase family